MYKITLEPVIFLFAFAYSIILSMQTQTNLLIWKVCTLENNHSEEVCGNLSSFSDIQANVQIRVNNFELVQNILQQWPSVIYSFFVGSLSDEYGRKPCILLPLIGAFIGNIFNFINYALINQLPTEFFYLCGSFWYNILGGNGVFALGYYGFGASISTDENRAKVLGMFF